MNEKNNPSSCQTTPYCKAHIPSATMTELEAGAFRKLCSHLRERSDAVQNIDLMTISGFCRNCLAKWLVFEARRVSDEIKNDKKLSNDDKKTLIRALDALGYDEAAEEVYGCTYPEWKKRHAKKATDEQLKAFDESKPIQATHDKTLLKTRSSPPPPKDDTTRQQSPSTTTTSSSPSIPPNNPPLLSDVCCQNVDTPPPTPPTPHTSSYIPPPPPSEPTHLHIGILTISDRASSGSYPTGDLSGPAVERALSTTLTPLPNVTYDIIHTAIVPDDTTQISQTLTSWTDCNLILTTGGTGFSPRDVTPEATQSILKNECRGLMPYVSQVCTERGESMACLSRGVAGITGSGCFIANLPGRPGGVKGVIEVLVPLVVTVVGELGGGEVS